jgi:hypothetical protein
MGYEPKISASCRATDPLRAALYESQLWLLTSHTCVTKSLGGLLAKKVKSKSRGRRIVVSSAGRAIPSVTLPPQKSVHIPRLSSNSVHPKILRVSLTRSRFCGEKFFPTLCFQYFAQHRGRGGIQQLPVVSGQLLVFWHASSAHCRFDQRRAQALCQQPRAKNQEPRAGSM